MKMQELREIIRKGILAPSGDNMQPWQFRLREDGVDLYLFLGKELGVLEAGYRSLFISAGAVIENMRVQAAHFGYRLTPFYFPEKDNPFWAVRARFERSPKETGLGGHCTKEHYRALELRCTNRKFYDAKKGIEPSVYMELEQIANSEKGFKLLWIKKEEPSYEKLCRLVGETEQLRFESPRCYEGFRKILRFGDRKAQSAKDGLHVKTLEAGFFNEAFFNFAASWRRMKLFNCFGASRLAGIYARSHLEASQAAGLLVAASGTALDYVRGGEVMERFWHEMVLRGLAAQPIMTLPILITALQREKEGIEELAGFSSAQKMSLGKFREQFHGLFPDVTNQNGLIFLFRMGYAEPPSARSLRRPLESFLIDCYKPWNKAIKGRVTS